jgi:polysaccharide export outer membrane protein
VLDAESYAADLSILFNAAFSIDLLPEDASSHWLYPPAGLLENNISANYNDRYGRLMKATCFTLASTWLFATSALVCSAQTAGKPVIAPASTAAAATLPASAVGGPVDTSTYVIGPEDQIQVTVWKEPQLTGPLMVRPDGKISLPLIHDIQAAGFTPTQLSNDIAQRLDKYLTDPTVDVTVLAVKSKNIYLMGEVSHVGPIPIAPGMSILQAIATAGGLTPYANPKKIYILRGDPAHQKQIPFNYNKAKKGDMQGIELMPGDTIFVQ